MQSEPWSQRVVRAGVRATLKAPSSDKSSHMEIMAEVYGSASFDQREGWRHHSPLDDLFESFTFLTTRRSCLPCISRNWEVLQSLSPSKSTFCISLKTYCSCFPVQPPPLSVLVGSSLLSLSLRVMFSGSCAAFPFAALTPAVCPAA